MAILNPTTSIGKMRLRVGDFSDLPIMPDEVYLSALDDCQGNIPRAVVLMARYILAALTAQTHQKLAQVEVYGGEWYNNYLSFIRATILNPHMMETTAMPYVAGELDKNGNAVEVPLVKFMKEWNEQYQCGGANVW